MDMNWKVICCSYKYFINQSPNLHSIKKYRKIPNLNNLNFHHKK